MVEREVRESVRVRVGRIAGLGGVWWVEGRVVPRTRSGKVRRRALRGLLEGDGGVPDGVEGGRWEELRRRVGGGRAKL